MQTIDIGLVEFTNFIGIRFGKPIDDSDSSLYSEIYLDEFKIFKKSLSDEDIKYEYGKKFFNSLLFFWTRKNKSLKNF